MSVVCDSDSDSVTLWITSEKSIVWYSQDVEQNINDSQTGEKEVEGVFHVLAGQDDDWDDIAEYSR